MIRVTQLRKIKMGAFPHMVVGNYEEIIPSIYFEDEETVEQYLSFLKEKYKDWFNHFPLALIEYPEHSVVVKLYD